MPGGTQAGPAAVGGQVKPIAENTVVLREGPGAVAHFDMATDDSSTWEDVPPEGSYAGRSSSPWDNMPLSQGSGSPSSGHGPDHLTSRWDSCGLRGLRPAAKSDFELGQAVLKRWMALEVQIVWMLRSTMAA